MTAGAAELFSIDLHGDILLDVLARRRMGEHQVLMNHHLPGLQKAGVRVQVLPIYVFSEFLPESGLRQVMRTIDGLYEEVRETPDYFVLVHGRQDLDRALAENKIALVMAFEGVEPLDRDVELVRVFHRLGLRMIGLTWNRANAVAQGLAEDTGAGISVVGRELLGLMDELGMILDLSHASPSSFWSALEHFKGKVVASHSNAQQVCAHPRNLSDEQIKAIAARDGLIGLNFLPRFVGGKNLLEGLVRHAEYIRDLVGLGSLALGPDFMNYLPHVNESPKQRLVGPADPEAAPTFQLPDVTLFPALYETFLDNDWSDENTAAVFGGNALRFLRANLSN